MLNHNADRLNPLRYSVEFDILLLAVLPRICFHLCPSYNEKFCTMKCIWNRYQHTRKVGTFIIKNKKEMILFLCIIHVFITCNFIGHSSAALVWDLWHQQYSLEPSTPQPSSKIIATIQCSFSAGVVTNVVLN